mgnify:CR=1 FL=1
MILERLQIPDEIYEQYGSVEALQERLVDTADYPKDRVVLGPETVRYIQEIFGGCKDEDDIVTRLKRFTVVKVQGKEIVLDAGQVQRLVTQAFFYSKTGEPRCPEEATSEEQEFIVNRYVDQQINYYISQMLGEI